MIPALCQHRVPTRLIRHLRPSGLLLIATLAAAPAGADAIRIAYLAETHDRPPTLSNLDDPPADEGIAGAELGIADNNTTGKFTGQNFELVLHRLDAAADPAAAIAGLGADGIGFVLLDVEADTLARILAGPLPERLLMFNVAAQDRRFRDRDCHPALLHTALSRDMRSDALAQFLVRKRWRNWLLVTGPRAGDRRFADAVQRSAKKFGARIVEQRDWNGEFDARRSAQAEVPLFTQGSDYDVLVVADELGDFGDYLMFNTWHPRPVAGTQGLTAQAWGRAVEQWGATQLQERFLAQSRRRMLSRDYTAWLAVRALGEAALRSRSGSYREINEFIRSDGFQLAGFKGRKMNFRSWNGQMRQPVPLLWARALVSLAPLEGFLHQHSELDTLGLDRAESSCRFN